MSANAEPASLTEYPPREAAAEARGADEPDNVEVFDIPRGNPNIEKQLATMVFGCY